MCLLGRLQTFLEGFRNSWKVEGNRMMTTDCISGKELSSLCFSAGIESLWIYSQNQRTICTLWII
jgi:hypothetical protein